MKKGFTKPKSGYDAGDHPPITPTTNIPSGLGGASARIYDFVVKHYMGTLAPNAKLEKTHTTFKIGQYTFTHEGVRILEPGYSLIMTWVTFAE